MMVVKRNLLFQGAIFGFHVKLWEGTPKLGRNNGTDPVRRIQFDEDSFQMRCFNQVYPPTGDYMPPNIAPEKWWLEDCFPFWTPFFMCYVSFREGGNYI